jgi:uncharacterized surface protein with fasciclin (FAS1) repeats
MQLSRMFSVTKSFAVLASLLSLGAIASTPALSQANAEEHESFSVAQIDPVELEPVQPEVVQPEPIDPISPPPATTTDPVSPSTVPPSDPGVTPPLDQAPVSPPPATTTDPVVPSTIPPTDPGLTDPGLTDPGVTEPGVIDPGVTEPGVTEPLPPTTPEVTPPVTEPTTPSPAPETPPTTAPQSLDGTEGTEETFPIDLSFEPVAELDSLEAAQVMEDPAMDEVPMEDPALDPALEDPAMDEVPMEDPALDPALEDPAMDSAPEEMPEAMPGDMPEAQIDSVPGEAMPGDVMPGETAGNLVDTAVSYGTFNTLVQAVEAAGLAEVLAGEGPYTVFAPTDEAFAELPEGLLEALLQPENQDLLVRILTYHVAEGAITSDQIESGAVPTVDGGAIAILVTEDQVIVNDGSVVAADIEATNGVIHAINRVLLPPDIQELLSADSGASSEAEVVQ